MNAEETIPNPAVRPRVNWLRALVSAAGAVYGPQVVMGLFTLCVVSCQDCRVTVWKMLVIAPGVEIAVSICMLLQIHRPATSNTANLLIVSVLSVLGVVGVAASMRHWAGWHWLIVSGFALAFGAGAFLLLAMIRA